MSNVVRLFPQTATGIPATRIPREEFERLAELALDLADRLILLLDDADAEPDAPPT